MECYYTYSSTFIHHRNCIIYHFIYNTKLIIYFYSYSLESSFSWMWSIYSSFFRDSFFNYIYKLTCIFYWFFVSSSTINLAILFSPIIFTIIFYYFCKLFFYKYLLHHMQKILSNIHSHI